MNGNENEKEVVVGQNLTSDWLDKYDGIIREFHQQLSRGLREPGKGLTLEQLQLVVEHQNPFATDFGGPLRGWEKFYRKRFGLMIDFSGVRIPEKQEGFDRLIMVAKGLTPNQAFDACKKNFPAWRYIDNLDKATKDLNDREPRTESYAIWVRDRIEADEKLKKFSANELKEKGIPGITLLERLVYELKYWSETGQHLDIQNWTLCSGSRNSDGSIPSVRWRGSRLGVNWVYPSSRFDDLRSRAVVPCQP